MMFINNFTLNQIKDHCLIKKNEESCGLIYYVNNNYYIYKCKNIASNPKKTFLIDPDDYTLLMNRGKVVGCYHSHTKGSGFSNEDILNSLESDVPYILYNILLDKFYFFDPEDKKVYKKYINLDYIHGVNDCWSTIGKYMNLELKIKVSDPEPDRILNEDKNLSWSYEDRKKWMNENNIYKVVPNSIDDIKPNDILVMKYNQDLPAFGALALEDHLILHQSDHEKSKIEYLRKAYFKMIDYVGRFKSE